MKANVESKNLDNIKILLKPTYDFNSIANVSACYVDYSDFILLLKRTNNNLQGNTWCIPGGKLEPFETPIQAVIREVFEETSILLNNNVQFIKTLYVRYPKHDFIFHMFYHKFFYKPSIILDPNEHESYRWTTLEDAKLLPMVLGGIQTLDYYEKFISDGKDKAR